MRPNYVQHMLILFAAIVAIGGCSPRTLSGWYCSTRTNDLAGTSYVFSRDSTFTSVGWTCFGSDTGAGRYTLTKDSLILVYDTLENHIKTVTTLDTVLCTGDSCTFNLRCVEREPLVFVSIEAAGPTGAKYFALTDTSARATLKIARTDFPLSITFRYTGFTTLRVTFDKPMSYSLSVRMMRSGYIIPGGTVMAYGVKRITPRKIVYEWDYENDEGKKVVVKSWLYRRRQ